MTTSHFILRLRQVAEERGLSCDVDLRRISSRTGSLDATVESGLELKPWRGGPV